MTTLSIESRAKVSAVPGRLFRGNALVRRVTPGALDYSRIYRDRTDSRLDPWDMVCVRRHQQQSECGLLLPDLEKVDISQRYLLGIKHGASPNLGILVQQQMAAVRSLDDGLTDLAVLEMD